MLTYRRVVKHFSHLMISFLSINFSSSYIQLKAATVKKSFFVLLQKKNVFTKSISATTSRGDERLVSMKIMPFLNENQLRKNA